MSDRHRVFITGVSSGIGNALSKAYLDNGWEVFGLSRRGPEELIHHERFHFMQVDITSFDTVPDAIGLLLGNISELDLVVLNAGILGEVSDLRDTSLDELKKTFDVNLWANKVLIDTITSSTKVEQIVAISSGAAINGNRGWSGYALSKAALNMMAQLYARELPDVHFSAFAPGLVNTRMQDHLCDEVTDARFESLDRLRAARHTDDMPTPEALAPKLIECFMHLRSIPSGEFRDIRKM